METRVFDFSGIYRRKEYGFPAGVFAADFKAMPGTAFYCDDSALEAIRSSLPEDSCTKINFIDSGDFHYMSAILAERIKKPFALILIDNHPDMQSPAFGDILSCGGWVRWLLERQPLLRKVLILGIDPGLVSETSGFPGRVTVASGAHGLNQALELWLKDCYLPLYISIDKDVLSTDYALTDWDQGSMTLEELLSLCRIINSCDARLLSVDICGEPSCKRLPAVDTCCVTADCSLNAKANRAIAEVFQS